MTGIGEVSDSRLDDDECCMPPLAEEEGDDGDEGAGEEGEGELAIGDEMTSESGARGSEADI